MRKFLIPAIFAVCVTCSAGTIPYSFSDFSQFPGDGESILAAGQSGNIPSAFGDSFLTAWVGTVTFGPFADGFGLFQLTTSIGGAGALADVFTVDNFVSGVHSLQMSYGPLGPPELFIDGQWKVVNVIVPNAPFASGVAGQTVPFSVTIDLQIVPAPEPGTFELVGVAFCLFTAARLRGTGSSSR